MRLLLYLIEGRYPASRENIEPMIWDLHDRNRIRDLVLLYGNGDFLELRAIGENELVIDALRGIAVGTGKSEKVELSREEKQSLWLFQEGYDCYRQPTSSGGYSFINPQPQPDKFKGRI